MISATGIRENLVTVLHARWKMVLDNRRACLHRDSVDAIHDLRVSTRRLRAVLDLLAPLFPDGEATRAGSFIRRLTRGLGKIRNLDEALIFFSHIDDDPESPLFSDLRDHLQTGRTKEMHKVRKLLRSMDISVAHNSLRQASGTKKLPAGSLAGYFSTCGIRLYEEIYYLQPVAQQPEHVEIRHALRIAIKHWRYFLEVAAEVFSTEYTAALELLKDYQTVLGHLNDLVEFTSLAQAASLTAGARTVLASHTGALTDKYLRQFAELQAQQPIRYVFQV